jgi:hypothetical protein
MKFNNYYQFKQTFEEQFIEEPVIEEQIIEEEINKEQVIEEKIIEEEINKEQVIEESVIEEQVIEESVIEEPVIEEPVIEEQVIEEQVIEEPVIEEQVIEEQVIEEEINKEPVIEEEINRELVIEEQVIEEEINKEPVIEEEINRELVIEDQVIEESVKIDDFYENCIFPTFSNIDVSNSTYISSNIIIKSPDIKKNNKKNKNKNKKRFNPIINTETNKDNIKYLNTISKFDEIYNTIKNKSSFDKKRLNDIYYKIVLQLENVLDKLDDAQIFENIINQLKIYFPNIIFINKNDVINPDDNCDGNTTEDNSSEDSDTVTTYELQKSIPINVPCDISLLFSEKEENLKKEVDEQYLIKSGDIIYIPELHKKYHVKIDELDMIEYNPYMINTY